MMKKHICGLLALVLLLLAGCNGSNANGNKTDDGSGAQAVDENLAFFTAAGLKPDETVMTADGNAVPAEVYCYWLGYNCNSLEYQVSWYNTNYNLYSELVDEQGKVLWDVASDGMDGKTLAEFAKEQADYSVRFFTAIENLAAEYDVALTEADTAAMEASYADSIEKLGSEAAFNEDLAGMGISRASFDRLNRTNYLFTHLTELVMQEGSPLYLSPEDYNQYASFADHILLTTVDSSTGSPLPEAEVEKKRALAEDLLAQLHAAENPMTLFAQLADEYSEDPGRATNPDGYIYTPGTMVTEFEDAVAALEPGELSEIVESTYGYHIILRKDLVAALEGDADQKTSLAEAHLESLLKLEMDNNTPEYSEKLDSLDVEAFYTAYAELMTARMAAENGDNAADDAGTDGGDNGGDAADNAADDTGTDSGDDTSSGNNKG